MSRLTATVETNEPWYQSFFRDSYLKIYAPLFSNARTNSEVDRIASLLDLSVGNAVLDLACGYGRHAIALARRGYDVTGQDLSEVLLQRAREDASKQNTKVQWVHSDMRQIPFDQHFDVVINMFNAFGYLEHDDDHINVLKAICRALKPGGLVLIETMHRDIIGRNYQAATVRRADDDLVIIDERHFDQLTGRNNISVTLIERSGCRTTYPQSMRVFTLTEFAAMIKAAGLHLHAYFGGLDGSPFHLGCSSLVLVAQRPMQSHDSAGGR